MLFCPSVVLTEIEKNKSHVLACWDTRLSYGIPSNGALSTVLTMFRKGGICIIHDLRCAGRGFGTDRRYEVSEPSTLEPGCGLLWVALVLLCGQRVRGHASDESVCRFAGAHDFFLRLSKLQEKLSKMLHNNYRIQEKSFLALIKMTVG